MTDFPPAEKVRVLLAEHATLRVEIIARTGHGHQLVALGASGLAILAAAYINTFRILPVWAFVVIFVVLLATISIVLGFIGWFNWRDIKKKAAQRIREIEIDINYRADEDLLIWENLWGGATTGFWGPAKPLPRETLQKAPAPIRSRRGIILANTDHS